MAVGVYVGFVGGVGLVGGLWEDFWMWGLWVGV